MDDLLYYVRHEIAMDGDEGAPTHRLDAFIQAYYDSQANANAATNESGPAFGEQGSGASAFASTSANTITEQNTDEAFREFVWQQLITLPEIKVAYLRKVGPQEQQGGDDDGTPGPATATAGASGEEDGDSFDLSTMKATEILKHKSKIKAARKDGKSKARDARIAAGEQWQFCQLPREEVDTLSRQQLIEKYGEDTLRVAVDAETSFVALTGSHERRSKLTHLSYQVLQAIARGREDGKTVIELGREFAHDQKSLFHFVKNLVEMNLIVKMRVLEHKSHTSRCIHRRYLETSAHWAAFMTRDPEEGAAAGGGDDDDDEDSKPAQLSILTAAHLNSNEPLIRKRIMAALRAATDNTIVHSQLCFAIGFQVRPNEMGRRRLNRIVQTMVNLGMIEKVGLARKNARGLLSCLRAAEGWTDEEAQVAGQIVEVDEERPNLLLTVPVERQMLDLLVEAGARGLTVRELRGALGDINRRVIESVLTRFEKGIEPPHLCDYRIQSVLETEGREKRLRWFTVAGYHERCRVDGLQDLPDQHDFSHPDLAGAFAQLGGASFYSTPEDFHKHASRLYTGDDKNVKATKPALARGKGKGKGKRAAASAQLQDAAQVDQSETGSPQPPKRGRGRPPLPKRTKYEKHVAKLERKVQAGEATQEELDKLIAEGPKPRGRPRKHPRPNEDAADGSASVPSKPAKRARKQKQPEELSQSAGMEAPANASASASALSSMPPAGGPTDGEPSASVMQRSISDAERFASLASHAPPSRGKADGPSLTNAVKTADNPAGKAASKPRKRVRKSEATPTGEDIPVPGADAGPATPSGTTGDPSTSTPASQTPPIRGRPRKYPPGTTSHQRAKLLEERRKQGLEPPSSKKAKAGKREQSNASEVIAAVADSSVAPLSPELFQSVFSAAGASLHGGDGPPEVQVPVASQPIASNGDDGSLTVPGASYFALADAACQSPAPGSEVAQLPTHNSSPGMHAVGEATMLSESTTPNHLHDSSSTLVRAQVEMPQHTSESNIAETPVLNIATRSGVPETTGASPAADLPLASLPQLPPLPGRQSEAVSSPSIVSENVPDQHVEWTTGPAAAIFTDTRQEDVTDKVQDQQARPPMPSPGSPLSQPLIIASPAAPSGPSALSTGEHQPEAAPSRKPSTILAAQNPLSASQGRVSKKGARPDIKKGSQRINLTNRVHENEYHAVLRENGGVMEDGKPFERAWQEYMLRKNGTEPYQLDKRTVTTVLNGLETRGLGKRTIVQIADAQGNFTQRTLWYLPELSIDSPEVREYAKTLEAKLQEIGGPKNWLPNRRVLTGQGELAELDVKVSKSVRTVRLPQNVDPHAFFSGMGKVVAQTYGWQYGRLARLRSVHQYLVSAITDENDSQYIVSSDPQTRMFASPFLTLETPLSVYLKVGPCQQYNDALDAFLASHDSTKVMLKDLDRDLMRSFLHGKNRPNARFGELLQGLVDLGLVVAMERVEHETPIVIYSGVAREPRYFREKEHEAAGVAYWMLRNEAPVYNVAEEDDESRTLLAALPLHNSEQADRFWSKLKEVDTQKDSSVLEDAQPEQTPAHPYSATIPSATSAFFRPGDKKRWQDSFYLLDLQRDYLRDFCWKQHGKGRVLEDAELMAKAAYDVCAPADVVRRFIESDPLVGTPRITRGPRSRQKGKARRKSSKKKGSTAANGGLAEESSASETEGAHCRTTGKKDLQLDGTARSRKKRQSTGAMLADKAANAQNEKQEVFEGVISHFASVHGPDAIPVDQIDFLREWFLQPGGINVAGLRQHLEANLGVLETTVNEEQRLQLQEALQRKTVSTATGTGKVVKTPGRRGRPPKSKVSAREEARGQAERAYEDDDDDGPEIPVPLLPAVVMSDEHKTAAGGWHEAEDDQLRDFYVILQARANHLGHRFSIDPAKPFYPGITGKTILDRLRRLADHDGEAPYLDALQDAWNKIWLRYRGSRRLPERDLRAYDGVDLHLHRSFLAAHVNKKSIRFQSLMPAATAAAVNLRLPADSTTLHEDFVFSDKSSLGAIHDPKSWDYLWSMITTIQKGKDFNHRPFVSRYEETSDSKLNLSAAQRVSLFSQRHVFSKSLASSVRQEANAFEKRLVTDKEIEYSLLSPDGDMLAVCELFSRDLLDIALDTTSTLEGRPYTDYRTRKIDDESFENTVTLSLKEAYFKQEHPIFRPLEGAEKADTDAKEPAGAA